MAKYKTFNQYLEECSQMGDALNDFEKAVQAKYDGHGYPYIAGYMMMQFREAVMELPRARREQFKAQFQKEAKRFEQEHLMKTIKESA
jgi:hypothetical protein